MYYSAQQVKIKKKYCNKELSNNCILFWIMHPKSEFNPTVAALGHEKDVEQDWIEVKIGDTIYLEQWGFRESKKWADSFLKIFS